MARFIKSLPTPEQGYKHREHRSKKGRAPRKFDYQGDMAYKIKKRELKIKDILRDNDPRYFTT